MPDAKLTIAVISDLHCHGPNEYKGRKKSFLVVGDPRVPEKNHPVQALIDLVRREEIQTDVIICAGDLANESSQVGLSHSWDLLQGELMSALGCDSLVVTIGNHDVTSRKSGDPFRMAKHVHPEFPVQSAEEKDRFWNRGFCTSTHDGKASFVIINTTHDHYDTKSAKRGTFDSGRIEDLDQHLGSTELLPIRIAVLHHHPVLHSIIGHDSSDVLATGDEFLRVLATHGFQMIIHGHRHQPRIRRVSIEGQNMFVLGAGSFSRMLKELSSRTRNVFHIVELQSGTSMSTFVRGHILTWEFNYGDGWNPSTRKSSEFPRRINLGPQATGNLAHELNELFDKNRKLYLPVDYLYSQLDDLKYLLPDEFNGLDRCGKEEVGLALDFTEYGELRGVGKIIEP